MAARGRAFRSDLHAQCDSVRRVAAERFDIVLNNLAGLARTTGKIEMTSDGTPWRPLVHVLDICQSIELTLRAPADRVRGEAFNVGDDAQNYRVRQIAEIVAAAFPGCSISFGAPSADNRSYRVSFEEDPQAPAGISLPVVGRKRSSAACQRVRPHRIDR